MPGKKASAVFTLIISLLLSLDAALPAFKNLGIGFGFLIWLVASLFALAGPFASMIFDIPFFAFISVGFTLPISLLVVLVAIGMLYIRRRNAREAILALLVTLWIGAGAYFSTIGILSSV